MVLNLWSILLIASASQCVFLALLLVIRPSQNRAAQYLLTGLLLVVLATNVHNLIYAGRIYYSTPAFTGFGRGLVLLVGPLFYLYTCAIVDPGFKFRWKHLLHTLPYLLGLTLISSQRAPGSLDEAILLIDAFMTTGIKASPLPLIRFSLYVVHILAYIYAARMKLRAKGQAKENYLIPMEARALWVKRLHIVFGAIATIQFFHLGDALISGYYTFHVNFVLTLVYSFFVYVIAYQVVFNVGRLMPGFGEKYASVKIGKDKKESLVPQLLQLFEEEKVYLNPELKLADVAARLSVAPHVLTTLLNAELQKTFFEFLNQYRVEAFIGMAKDPQYAHLSIMGIAHEAGYKSKSSFNTAFKKIKGQTPSEYLKMHD